MKSLILLLVIIASNLIAATSTINFSAQLVQPIINNDGIVNVSWQNVPPPPNNDYTNDWVAMFWLPFAATYVQYANVSGSSTSGSFTFTNIINARHHYVFYYFRGNTSLAQSQPVAPEPHIPMQIRLSLVLNDEASEDESGTTKMTITWTSDRVTYDSCVRFGSMPVDPSLPIYTNPPPVSLNIYAYVDGNVTTYNATELNERVKLPPIPQRTTLFDNINFKGLRCGWLPPPFENNSLAACWDDTTATSLFVDPGLFLSVVLYDLQPGMRYYYQVGECPGSDNNYNAIMSDVRSFVSKPLPSSFSSSKKNNKKQKKMLKDFSRRQQKKLSSLNENVNILFFADVGTGPVFPGFEGGALHNDIRMKASEKQSGARFVIESIQQKNSQLQQNGQTPITLAILGGDVSYSRGWPFISESFHNLTSNGLFDTMPIQIVPGNHGWDTMQSAFKLARCTDSGGEAGIVLGKRFFQNLGTGFLQKPYYSFRFGSVFFIMLSTEHKCEEQVTYVQSVVAADSSLFDRSVTPWLVVVLHRPLYSLMSFDNATFAHHLEEKYADTFTNAGVDMVLQGHQHQYTRFCGISSGGCSSQWGFRDIYEKFENVVIAASAEPYCFLNTVDPNVAAATSTNECRRACNKNTMCTGIQWFVNRKCQLLQCPQISFAAGTVSEYIGSKIFVLAKREYGKQGPYFVLDGTGGAQFSQQAVQYDSRVRYTDVNRFGYSLLNANSTTLHWQHFHVPTNMLADDLILQK